MYERRILLSRSPKGARCLLPVGDWLTDKGALLFDRGQIRFEVIQPRAGVTWECDAHECRGRSGLLSVAMREGIAFDQVDLEQFDIDRNATCLPMLDDAVKHGYVRQVAVPLVCGYVNPPHTSRIVNDEAMPLLVKAAALPFLNAVEIADLLGEVRWAMAALMPAEPFKPFALSDPQCLDALGAAAVYLFTRDRGMVRRDEDYCYMRFLVREAIFADLLNSGLLPWAKHLASDRSLR